MRNAAELRAAASATGIFDSYVGDGATVPWQVGFVGGIAPAVSLWAYKAYLDSRWPHAFKLHDWLYTPYGAMIEATREEADSALYEDIAADSILDAGLVYASVRAFGGLYFGSSQTGYSPGSGASGGNIAEAPSETFFHKEPGMPAKIVILFQQVTEKGTSDAAIGLVGRSHIAGWSESHWLYDVDVPVIDQLLRQNRGAYPQNVLPARAELLNSDASILGVRLYIGGSGEGRFLPYAYPGRAATCDIPSMALLLRMPRIDGGGSRRFTIRGVPDVAVVGGELQGSQAYRQALAEYFSAIQNTLVWGDASVATHEVVQISAAGLVSLRVNTPFAVGAWVTFRNAVTADGYRVGGEYLVSAIGPLNNQFTVTGWEHGECSGGDVRIPSRAAFNLTAVGASVSRVVTRKVGRPFELYRGRQSART